ncbi:MAG TPA: Mur ligase family protein [Thermomicrobiales bacterium]|nr:Mur ligase family protein [Thermomicrobiales bacterium]
MEMIEVRDLDGPNLFALHPVIKLEVRLDPDDTVSPDARVAARSPFGADLPAEPIPALREAIAALHRRVGLPVPEIGVRALDTPGHEVVFFDWSYRETALEIGRQAVAAVSARLANDSYLTLERLLKADRENDDHPLWIRDEQRRLPSVGITGTNGKTTTTRMVAHIVRQAGYHAGWTSTSGVYIDGEQVVEGDYTGPSGARRVLLDPTVDYAILETARGGLLLRGLACESNDVGVFLNVSPDHLDMQGVETVETLAEVKSVVVRVTRPDGLVVLNADDPLVLAQREHVRAPVLLTSQNPASEPVARHVADGGQAIVRDGDMIWRYAGPVRQPLIALDDVPATFGGAATHMVENALAAIGAAIGLGFTDDQIVEGLQRFRSDIRSNAGRLNVFRLDGRVIVVDYAHNEQGLEMLLAFARRIAAQGARVVAIVGTAGDRQDVQLRGLGTIGAEQADRVYLKETGRYLRGREPGEVTALMQDGVACSQHPERLAGCFDGEHAAFLAAISDTGPGDAIAIMCLEEQLTVLRELRDRGAEEW